MNKKMLFWSASLLTAAVIPTAIVLKVQNNQLVNNEIEAINIAKNQQMNQGFDLKESQKYFLDYIQWLNDQNDPIALFNVSASLPYQEALFIAMVNQFNGSKNQLTMIQEEKFRDSPRYDIDKLIAKNNSPINVLNSDKDQPNKIINEINQDKINILYDQRDPNAIIPQSKSQVAEDHIAPILNYLIESTKNSNKINIVIPDIYFMQLFDAFSPSVNNPLIQLLSKAKSILLTTDGNGHIVKVVENGLLKFVLSPEFNRQSEQTIKENLKNIQDLNAEKISKLTKNDIYNLLLLEEKIDSKFDFIHFVHYDSSYANNLFSNKTDQNGNFIELLDEDKKWKVSSVSLNVLDYANLLKDQSKKAAFIKSFDEAFFVDDKSELFVSLDQDNFDPKKKTAIFIGSSLFSPQITRNHEVTSLEEFTNLREYVQNSFNQFLTKYPQDEYNIVFKHHPVYSAEDSVKLTKIYTNNQIEIPNVINSRIPFEYLLSSELAKAQRGEESILFFKNSKQEIEPKFKLFGFQATTSLIHTTRLFLETSLKISHDEIEKVISFDDFLVPTLFDVIEKPIFDPKKYNKFESNRRKIENSYRFFNPSQWNSEIGNENDRFLFNEIKPLGNDENIINDAMINILLIGFALVVLSSIVAIPTTIYMIRKNKKNDHPSNLFLK